MDKAIQKQVALGQYLPLMEAFYTIQGEGYHKGLASFFVRIGGCDVGCHWCDVKESWNAETHPPTNIKDIVSMAVNYSKTVVITGGEPLMWNMSPITKALQTEGCQTHIETSGAYPFSGDWNWVCLSPKKRKLPLPEIYEKADELKVIVYNNSDFAFAEAEAKKVRTSCQLFLQPEWSRKDEISPLIVDYVMKNPHWKISLQTHKYLNIP